MTFLFAPLFLNTNLTILDENITVAHSVMFRYRVHAVQGAWREGVNHPVQSHGRMHNNGDFKIIPNIASRRKHLCSESDES